MEVFRILFGKEYQSLIGSSQITQHFDCMFNLLPQTQQQFYLSSPGINAVSHGLIMIVAVTATKAIMLCPSRSGTFTIHIPTAISAQYFRFSCFFSWKYIHQSM